MVNSDLKFFDNINKNSTLLNEFNTLAQNSEFLDVVVGYFRTSGFCHIYKNIQHMKKVRILVGVNIDRRLKNSIESLSSKQKLDLIKERILFEYESSKQTFDVEQGINTFLKMIAEGRLEVKMYYKSRIHAKVYMFYPSNSAECKIISGSSNLTEEGLFSQIEFDTEFNLQDENKEKAKNKFEALWNDASSDFITDDIVNTLKKDTWFKDNITPYEMYLKFLYEYLKDDINVDTEQLSKGRLPENFVQYTYQKEAVLQAKKIIENHNGVFLSDVVGLGKTYTATMIARELQGVNLVICPPHMTKEWEESFRGFGIHNDVVSMYQLNKLIENNDYHQYTCVIIDEAHRFRNNSTSSYEYLSKICRGKKIILVTATPFNNRVSDLENLIYLFSSKNNSSLPVKNGNLEAFFRAVRKYEKEDRDLLGETIRKKILEHVMIRRTRSDIEQFYKEDKINQGLIFPNVNDPINIDYYLSPSLAALFKDTLDVIDKLNYARYGYLEYLEDTSQLDGFGKDLDKIRNMQVNFKGFLKSTVVKRLESSFYAFKKTLDRMLNSYYEFLGNFNKGYVLCSNVEKLEELYGFTDENSDGEDLMYSENGDIKIPAPLFNTSFESDLIEDINMIEDLYDKWRTVSEDPKVDALIEKLKFDANMKNKVLIFTESKDTANYLEEKIGEVRPNLLKISSENKQSNMNILKSNFDPKSKIEITKTIDTVISTDVLSEGINLHKANVIINYDLPWNPTKIMQRVGRINRIGSTHSQIFIYNCMPSIEGEIEGNIKKTIVSKLINFHSLLGDDNNYLVEEEDAHSQNLFKSKKIGFDSEEPSDKEYSILPYVSLIRDIRDNNKKLFNKIVSLPSKSRCVFDEHGLNYPIPTTLTFFKKDSTKVIVQTSDYTTDIDFFDANRLMLSTLKGFSNLSLDDCLEELKSISSSRSKKNLFDTKFYSNLESNIKYFYEKPLDFDIKEDGKTKLTLDANTKKILILLKALKKDFVKTNDTVSISYVNDLIKFVENTNLSKTEKKSFTSILKLDSSANDKLNNLKSLDVDIYSYLAKPEYFSSSAEDNEIKLILSEHIISNDGGAKHE